MNAGWQRLQPWASVIVPALLHFLWQGALVALIAGVLMFVCPKSAASKRYAIFLGLFVLMAVMPLITASVVMQDVPLASSMSASDVDTAAFAPSHWQSQWHTEEFIAWQPIVLLAWLVGVALCSLRLTGGLMWYVWLTGRLEPISPSLSAVVTRLSQHLGMSARARVRVAVSHDVREPLAIRIIQPLIILPASWLLSAPPLMVEAVLAHELAHIRRHDLWVNLLQRIVETLLFFHPAVWWLSRQIRRERELCCDRLAVAATGRAVEYAQALEAVARFRLAWSSPAMAAGMGGDRMVLLERVRRVLGLETAPETGWWPVGVAGLLIAACCWTGVALNSGVAQGDEQSKLKAVRIEDDDDDDDDDDEEMEDEDDDDEDENKDRPRPPRADNREGDRRDPLRAEGDRRPAEGRREGDRPREGERAPGAPRDGERRPEERPRGDGERGPRPADAEWARRMGEMRRDDFRPRPDGDVMHELLATIRELRQEVQMLREEMRSMRGPGPGRGPRDGDAFDPFGRQHEDDRRDGDRRRREDGPADARPGREGPPREGRGGTPREGGLRPEGTPRGDRREDAPPRKEGRTDEPAPRRESDEKPAKREEF
ncbi:MAG TPA: M56 family metallopeptidase [Planctomycetaceae bacterium]|nr:M56 family metallopeptidase [Planctomycetaceae bacterium]